MTFKGEVGAEYLDSIKTGHTAGDTYRIIEAGKLGGVALPFGTFVEWKGTYWEVKVGMQYAVSNDGTSMDKAISDILDDHDSVGVDEEFILPTAAAANYIVGNYYTHTDDTIWRCTSKTNNGDGTYTIEGTKTNGVVPVFNDIIAQTLLNLGTKTEADLDDGTYTVIRANSHTTFVATTVAAMTVNANPGLGNFEMLIDNSGNANDVTITVKSNNGQTTYLHSSAAGTDVAAGKIAQLTCVGTCWTLAEFEA